MIKRIKPLIILAVSTLSPLAHADWITTTGEDLFSSGRTAMMLGTTSSKAALTFDCTKESLEINFVVEDSKLNIVNPMQLMLVVKVDDNQPTRFEGSASRRNYKYIQVGTKEAGIKGSEGIISVIKQIQNAKEKFTVRVRFNESGYKAAFSGNVRGATKATNDFINACEIKL
ncbi:hypothetical protein GTGU_01208 [Trabulsiella guamensis ATCC 49490]|uniref:Uncharacterized protein n=2 Tax=Trabulsiella guamensis TaxID=158852 RepID=A0A085AFM1_9ENTR|nr:hypothetical protein GTGU_01208 [Trabulsiella guamensis ATCC 49490]